MCARHVSETGQDKQQQDKEDNSKLEKCQTLFVKCVKR